MPHSDHDHAHAGHRHEIIHLPGCKVRGAFYCNCERDRYFISASLAFSWGVLQFIWARIIGSAAAEGDAIHLFIDGLQSSVSVFIVVNLPKIASAANQMRYKGALVQSALLVLASALIFYEGMTHDILPRSAKEMIVLGSISSTVALLRFWVVHGTWGTLTGKAEMLHVAIDVATSLAVVVAGVAGSFGMLNIDKPITIVIIAPVAFINAAYLFKQAMQVRQGHEHHH